MTPNAAILFEPDAYLLSEPKLMGRQAAGNSFLRAAVNGREEHTLFAYTPHQKSAEVFGQLIRQIDPTVKGNWIPADRLDLLAQVGTLYMPGPGLNAAASVRLRAGCAAYSLVGVTHTTASHLAMDSITGLLNTPVMPWDALICTSHAVLETVNLLLEAEIESLKWRFGSELEITLPQLPIIPLGIHCDDFEFSPDHRAIARAALNIEDDEIVLLFVGRLSFHAKAHPHAMYLAAQEVAKSTGKKITLLQCGWFGNDAIQSSFVNGAAQFCPNVRAIFVDGRNPELAKQSWASADIFISLSDNVQETFGITPIEAMAAGLPVIVSDWNGYKDTVRDGIDGFRIPTWMPPPQLGEHLAKMHETGTINYDIYCGLSCQTISISMFALIEKLTALVKNPTLRQKMSSAAKMRAKTYFDWRVIYPQYQSLYTELQTQRHAMQQNLQWRAKINLAPKASANRLDPFYTFGHYPTHFIQGQNTVMLQRTDALHAYGELMKNPLFNYAGQVLPAVSTVEKIVNALKSMDLTLNEIAQLSGLELGTTILAVAVLVKMDLLRLS
jgi:alpha-maltose-1-phosphate synthase